MYFYCHLDSYNTYIFSVRWLVHFCEKAGAVIVKIKSH